jgi:hypothetical protein
MIINSQIQLGKILQNFSDEEIKNEPMFFRATREFAYKHGGAPTKLFIDNLDAPEDILIDSRVHMLMNRWFPCIPGFHHDDVPRERADGQPEYYNPSYRSQHAMVLYNGTICPTEFAIGEQVFSNPEYHEIVYREWHKEVEILVNQYQLELIKAPNNQIIYFNDRTWHQGTQAVDKGFRLFIRATWDSKLKPKNEIRRQVQVYMSNPMQGW